MKKKGIVLIILLMVVGFATVSTILYINGNTNINANKDDFHVYYSDAYQNGKQDRSLIVSDTVIEFTTTFDTLGQKYILDYEVTNGSKNYDAELVMECTSGNEYLSVTNEFDDDTILESLKLRTGKLTLEQIKSYNGEDLSVTIKCTINANAVERESLGETNRSQIVVDAVDSNNTDLNAKSYQILGEDEEKLLDSLVETGFVSDASEVDALIEVESDDFEDFATTTFDVSSIAKEGDKVVILHFNEETQEWEYIGEETVDETGKVTADFTSYSPVAFVVVNEDGSLSPLCPYTPGQTWELSYTGGAQTFVSECKAIYKVELWGARGQGINSQGATRGGGLGTYVYGNIDLEKGTELNVYIGGAASGSTGGYNGGGNGVNNSGGGGGATDIRLNGTALANRIMVAGGGGGGPWFQYRTPDYSIDVETHEYGSEVTSVDTSSLGQGNTGKSGSYSYSGRTYTFASGGGGGGYYGGRSLAMISYGGQKAQHTWQSGGSSYIDMNYFYNYSNGVRNAITYSGTNGLVNFTTSNLTHYVQAGNGKATITLVEILY